MRRYAYRVEDLGPYRVNPLDHMGLAVSVARQFLRPNLIEADILQEALTALCAAARNYDPDKGTFATWATSLMKNHLKGVARSDSRMGSFGGRGLDGIYPNALRRYIRGGGSDLSVAGLQKMLQDIPHSSAITDHDLGVLVTHTLYSELSLDVPVHEGGDSPASVTLLIDTLVDESANDQHAEHEYAIDRERVLSRLNITDARERDIMKSRVLSDDPESLVELAGRWGISRERVRQIESKLIHRITASLAGEKSLGGLSKEMERNVLMTKSKILRGRQ
jgi:RNA polymerase sigma-32 factor